MGTCTGVNAISSASPTASISSTTQMAALRQHKQDYLKMMAAAQSGDATAAKAAYARLTANRTPPVKSPLAALGATLQSGDTVAIRQAAEALQQARDGQISKSADPNAPPPPKPIPAAAYGSSQTDINVLA
ncbi:MAG: hypothetical protein ACOY4B_11655 [Pseudomonadota bacterium]|jgi:hypothetical protein